MVIEVIQLRQPTFAGHGHATIVYLYLSCVSVSELCKSWEHHAKPIERRWSACKEALLPSKPLYW